MVTSFRKGNSWWPWGRNGFLCEVQPRDSQATELHHVSQSSSLKEVGRNYDRKGLKSWDKARVVTHQLLLWGKQTQCVDITIILLSITNRQQQTETESKLKSPFPPIHPLQPLLDTEEQGMGAVLSPEHLLLFHGHSLLHVDPSHGCHLPRLIPPTDCSSSGSSSPSSRGGLL